MMQKIPTTVHIETDQAELPNGPYCTGGPAVDSINDMNVSLEENAATAQELWGVVQKYLLKKVCDSSYTKTNHVNTRPLEGKILSPNDCEGWCPGG